MNEYYINGKKVLKVLMGAGYDAYFVGGFVRDKLLDIESNDIDIATNAKPEEVEKLFDKCIHSGKKYGTVTVFYEDFKYEITTFRSEGKYINNRHPESISFSDSIFEDVKRRDFTINAFAMNYDEKIIDEFSGEKDLNSKLIKCIGNPDDRFVEDALRILRAFRFVSKLNFDIDDETINSIKRNAHLIQNISNERVINELNRIFLSSHTKKALKYIDSTGISKYLMGLKEGISYLSDKDVDLELLEYYALCFKLSRDFDERWKFSNKEKALIKRVVDLAIITEEDDFNELLLYSYTINLCKMANNINKALGFKDKEEQIITLDNNLPIRTTCDLKFKGGDIIELTKTKDTTWIGSLVDDLKYQVIMGNLPNDYHILKEYAVDKMKQINKL